MAKRKSPKKKTPSKKPVAAKKKTVNKPVKKSSSKGTAPKKAALATKAAAQKKAQAAKASAKSKTKAKKGAVRPAAKSKASPAKASPTKTTPAKGVLVNVPAGVPDADFLPQWFGGFGLTQCFCNLKIGTVGDLRKTTEGQVREVCGQQDLLRLKACLELLESNGAQHTSRGTEDDGLASQTFAYFLRGGTVQSDGSETYAATHVCEIINRPRPDHATVRLGARLAGRWQDITIPVEKLELLSRHDRREQLEAKTPMELAGQAKAYELPIRGADPVDAILDFEFKHLVQKTTSKKAVLVIDDDPNVAASVQAVLESQGYQCRVCLDGATGLARAESERPDLLLLDLKLPDQTGFSIVEKLRQHYQMPRVIMMTASTDNNDRRLASELGIDDFLQKPFSMDMLMAAVEKVLN